MHTEDSCPRQECCVLSFSHDPISSGKVYMWESFSPYIRLDVPPEQNGNPAQRPCSQIHQMPSEVLKKMLHSDSIVSMFPVTLFSFPSSHQAHKTAGAFCACCLASEITLPSALMQLTFLHGEKQNIERTGAFSCLNSCLYLAVEIKGLTVAVILVIVLMEHPSIWQLCSLLLRSLHIVLSKRGQPEMAKYIVNYSN